MVRAVEGTFRGGKVELSQIPQEAEGARVVVVFMPEPEVSETTRQEAVRLLLEQMRNSSVRLGGKPYESRDELYDERIGRWIK